MSLTTTTTDLEICLECHGIEAAAHLARASRVQVVLFFVGALVKHKPEHARAFMRLYKHLSIIERERERRKQPTLPLQPGGSMFKEFDARPSRRR